MYTELLQRAIESIQAGQLFDPDAPSQRASEVELHVPALIPDAYLPDVHSRLTLYKRIANAADKSGLRELKVEMIDRFGLLPEPVIQLFNAAELKLRASPLGIRRLELGRRGGRIDFAPEPAIDVNALIDKVQSDPDTYRLEGTDRLRIRCPLDNPEHRLALADELLTALQP